MRRSARLEKIEEEGEMAGSARVGWLESFPFQSGFLKDVLWHTWLKAHLVE